jgi:uncharacterized cupin superfamily protein
MSTVVDPHVIGEHIRRLRSERHRLDSTWTDAHIEALGLMKQNHKLKPLIAVFGPGGMSGKRPHDQAREEFAFVIRGQVTLTLAEILMVSSR